MTMNSTSGSSSVFKDGNLKPGIYKIQNILSETYLDIEVHSREVCCRPAKDLGEGRGIWEIKSFAAGYTIQLVQPGEPEQFCVVMGGSDGSPLSVAAYPVAWRIEVVNDHQHRGFEYVRLHWITTNLVWYLRQGSKADGAKVALWTVTNLDPAPKAIWKFIPVKVDNVKGVFTPLQSSSEMVDSGSLRSYDGDTTGQPSARTQQYVESEREDLGTIVTEITTITTRRRYRVEDA